MENQSTLDLTFWNRLESRSRLKEFNRSLKAEIRDGFWMLGRQWQVGEFEAEDTGSPVFACMNWKARSLNQISLARGEAKDINQDLPLEAQVESLQYTPDLYLQLEMGRHFVRLLRKKLGQQRANQVSALFYAKEIYRFIPVPKSGEDESFANATLLINRELQQAIAAAQFAKALDGYKIYLDLKSPKTASQLIEIDNDDELNQVGSKFIKWFDNRYTQPQNQEKDAWLPERLEYEFSVKSHDSADGDIFTSPRILSRPVGLV